MENQEARLARKELVDALRLRFIYNPETGAITHARSVPPYHLSGDIAVTNGKVRHSHEWLPATKVAWALGKGEWPAFTVRPIDGDWANLRLGNLAPKTRVTEMARERVCTACSKRFMADRGKLADPNWIGTCSVTCSRALRPAIATCRTCGVVLGDNRAGNQRLCKPCDKVRNRQRLLAAKYGMTPKAFAALLAEQGGVCAVCGTTRGTGPVVDHCHTTGKVRGILCSPCNVALGQMEDSPELLRRAAVYLERPR